ncbi:MAG: hypothetical protein HYU42_15700 [Candidatus Rokubacteria bacterium]|nr:hypothetical protein [Candidatus Rokubacteria bacterium]MBI3109182.1 hypothetical protein [Candidatus Rokubacteria bacterium]
MTASAPLGLAARVFAPGAPAFGVLPRHPSLARLVAAVLQLLGVLLLKPEQR